MAGGSKIGAAPGDHGRRRREDGNDRAWEEFRLVRFIVRVNGFCTVVILLLIFFAIYTRMGFSIQSPPAVLVTYGGITAFVISIGVVLIAPANMIETFTATIALFFFLTLLSLVCFSLTQ